MSPPRMFSGIVSKNNLFNSKRYFLARQYKTARCRLFFEFQDQPIPETPISHDSPGSVWIPHYGIFPTVTPPDWDISSHADSADLWTMEISIKSMWNGATSFADLRSQLNKRLNMLSVLMSRSEGWTLDRPVKDGLFVLKCPTPAVMYRGCITNCVEFGIWPEIRRAGSNLVEGVPDVIQKVSKGYADDESLPYTLVDLKLMQDLELLKPGELDDMNEMHAEAKMAALEVLARFLALEEEESDSFEVNVEDAGLTFTKKSANSSKTPPESVPNGFFLDDSTD